MKPEDYLQRLFNQARIDTSNETDQRILAEAECTLVSLKSNKPMVGSAVAAIVLLTLGLVIWTHESQQSVVRESSQPIGPNQILTMESLKQAFNQGGMEALDKQYDMALHVVGPRLTLRPYNKYDM